MAFHLLFVKEFIPETKTLLFNPFHPNHLVK